MKKNLAVVPLLLGALALMPALAQQQDVPGQNSLQGDPAKFHRIAARAIPNQYIVVLEEDVDLKADTLGAAAAVFSAERRADEVMRAVGGAPTHVYAHAIHGFAMAAPHVAGVAARFLQSTPGATPAQVRNELVAQATTGRLSGIPSGTANRLLFLSSAR